MSLELWQMHGTCGWGQLHTGSTATEGNCNQEQVRTQTSVVVGTCSGSHAQWSALAVERACSGARFAVERALLWSALHDPQHGVAVQMLSCAHMPCSEHSAARSIVFRQPDGGDAHCGHACARANIRDCARALCDDKRLRHALGTMLRNPHMQP